MISVGAACLLIVRPTDLHVLTVSRKNQINRLGLPGGKWEEDDASSIHTACRETEEETGVIVLVQHCEHVYTGAAYGSTSHICSTYYATKYDDRNLGQKEPGMFVGWAFFEQLLGPDAPFAEYNKRLHDRYQRICLELLSRRTA